MAKEKSPKPKLKKGEIVGDFLNLGRVMRAWKSLSEDQKDFIKATIAPTLTEAEILLFLYRASLADLNPLNNEVYAYVQGGEGKERQLVIITARDAKRKVAGRTGKLGSIQVEAIYNKKANEQVFKVEPWEGGELWGAKATIYRKDFPQQPFVAVVKFLEYKRKAKIWDLKPETMIKKVAESQALSAAFPELLSGIYDESEEFSPEPKEEAEIKEDPRPATEEQKGTLETLGVKFEKDVTRGGAAQLIAEATKK